MRDARKYSDPRGRYAWPLTLTACGREEQPDENQVITDINAADPGDIEALPPDESVDPLPTDNVRPAKDTVDANQG